MGSDIRTASVEDLAAAVHAKEVSARELCDAALAAIDEHNGTLNAFVALDAEGARAAAAAIDDRLAAGDAVGPLAGIPIGVKDLEDAAGFVTTQGSALHAADAPAAHDSALVARLRAAGCVVLGKTNTPEHGWKAETDNEVFGATRNPWDTARTPGGSSGGSAAAVAAGLVPLATGSDGGGSIRIPSALCGLTGFKPAQGRISTGSETPDWPLLSSRGPMARRVRDVAFVLDLVTGPRPDDLYALAAPVGGGWRRLLDDPVPPKRVAWSPTLGYALVDDEVRALCEAALGTLEDAGAEIVEIDSVFPEDPVGDWLALAATYNLRSLAPWKGTPGWDRIDPGLRATVEWVDAKVTPVRVVEALDAAFALHARLADLLAGFDVLLTPTTAGVTPRCGESGTVNGQPDVNWVRFTYPFNLTQSPAGTVCAGLTRDGLPVGLQVVGAKHDDATVLRTLAVLEDALGVFVPGLPPVT